MHPCRLRVCEVANPDGELEAQPLRLSRGSRLVSLRGALSCGCGLLVRFPPLAVGSHGEKEGTGGESALTI